MKIDSTPSSRKELIRNTFPAIRHALTHCEPFWRNSFLEIEAAHEGKSAFVRAGLGGKRFYGLKAFCGSEFE